MTVGQFYERVSQTCGWSQAKWVDVYTTKTQSCISKIRFSPEEMKTRLLGGCGQLQLYLCGGWLWVCCGSWIGRYFAVVLGQQGSARGVLPAWSVLLAW